MIRRLFTPRTALAITLGASMLVVAEAALARPGGGQSFGGGSSGSSGGGSSGGGGSVGLIIDLIILLIRYPAIGVPVLIIVVIAVIVNKAREGSGQGWSSGGGISSTQRQAFQQQGPAGQAPVMMPGQRMHGRRQSPRERLEQLRATDHDFSLVLFEDFLYALYAETHTARGAHRLDRLTPWLNDAVRAHLGQSGPGEVSSIVVGSMKITGVQNHPPTRPGGPPWVVVTVDFEANYTETAGGRPQSYYVAERWKLSRAVNARSRPPGKERVFACPSCGAPLDSLRGRTCSYCKQQVDTGELDWLVTEIALLRRETRGPMLTGTTEEMGTNDPTIVSHDANERYAALCAKDPQLSWPGLVARIQLVFNQFQLGWSSQDLSRVRPFLSDNLFQTQLYWIDTYQKAGLRNVTEGAHVLTVQLARVVSDRWFDAVTVRVFASGLDYTLDGAGKVVGGSRSKPRDYSEYWTLIRGTGKTGAPRTDPVCPNCGAPLDINMAGHCKYCKAKVTTGEFDWVLSRIEQDEVYEG
ncbi:MAG: Tim44-like domain-containing protein [Byssovorax sp.]